jgi:hypothetical protein
MNLDHAVGLIYDAAYAQSAEAWSGLTHQLMRDLNA